MTAVIAEPINLATLPANKGIIFDGVKFYGIQDVPDLKSANSVELVDPDTCEVHRWHRKGHTVFKALAEGSKQYVSSEQMVGCPSEKEFGYCPERFHPHHKKHYFHFCRYPARFFRDKPVCRYSLTDKNLLCWEGTNAEHIKTFHHMD